MMRRKILKAGLALPVLAQLALPRSVHAARGLERVYAQPSPEILPRLPQDHGVHPAFRTEWWYFTGWFESPEFEQAFGVQITFFRSAPNVNVQNPSAFSPQQLLFAHAAVALPKAGKLVHEQIVRRAGRGGAELKTSSTEVLNIRMPGWHLQSGNGSQWQCRVDTPQLSMNLSMAETQTPWIQGQGGYSQKGPKPEQASYYITMPHLKSTGTIRIEGKTLPVQGTFWMDHEWSSTVLAPNAQGWDWVGLHGDQGESLMAFQIRDRDNTKPPVWTHAALRQANGEVRNFRQIQFKVLRQWKSTRTGIQYPVAQQLQLDEQTFELEPLFDDQELDARASTGTLYWEGAVRVKSNKASPWGRGYLEMTGYDRPMQL
ncbi:lipocalin-like domain-containing protein [Limnobacter sp. 130]|jgi:predicted secreted hydrolase|uniref:lipocalin-like domain-containing protein n=1 Tax=Limnobacter sp. 130 TaxID=2653147 RepID=UPI0012F1A637|nr:lipocalin-like domain-containing protein [Limnobacter sp. 130]VWX36276.1 Carotenoid 1,2-hydratase [Limnobacter sp. 130]